MADGHSDLKRHTTELREGVLTFYDKTRDNGIYFEDLFDTKTILKAMKNVDEKMSFNFEMDENKLEDHRKRDNVAHIIQDYLKVNAGMDLDKTLLARLLTANIPEYDGLNDQVAKLIQIIRSSPSVIAPLIGQKNQSILNKILKSRTFLRWMKHSSRKQVRFC